MELTLHRKYRLSGYSIGKLYINGEYFCDTLEDTDRGLDDKMSECEIIKIKVKDKTAIPTGTYHIDMDTVSPKFFSRAWAKPFNGKLPRLLNVKGYSGVLIHVGNLPSSTSGCVLVGKNTVKGQVTESTATFYSLMNNHLLPAHIKGEPITITIHR